MPAACWEKFHFPNGMQILGPLSGTLSFLVKAKLFIEENCYTLA